MKAYKCFVVFVLAMLLVASVTHACFAFSSDEAREAIRNAENGLDSAYISVNEAERAGADISELLTKLVYAGDLLAEANNFYRMGNYEMAFYLACNCSEVSQGVNSEAQFLKLKAEEAYNERLLFTAGISSVGLSLLFVLSLFGWRFLRRWYVRRVLKMKPEVEDTA